MIIYIGYGKANTSEAGIAGGVVGGVVIIIIAIIIAVVCVRKYREQWVIEYSSQPPLEVYNHE